ncbi:hypothetical protein CATRI_06770 [Corynebacterium atrinae]|nr:hypothetical protein [Corynebacterium atrinae]WJY63435.1 hypothetical protein CATRI_06770 [Corynebacterium atrinae]
MTVLIAAITGFMFYLDASPATLTVCLLATAWVLALDTRRALKNRTT